MGDGAHTHTHSNLSLALNVAVRLAIDPEATQRGVVWSFPDLTRAGEER